jgi:hypothetical protein
MLLTPLLAYQAGDIDQTALERTVIPRAGAWEKQEVA